MESWIDYQGKGLDLKLTLERTYNSRSTYVGWFGYGWCSDLETKLIADKESILVKHCGDGAETEYSKKGSVFKSHSDANGTIVKQGSNFLRSYKDGTVDVFDKNGRLTEIKKGLDYVSLKYNEKKHLKEVSDGNGRKALVNTNDEGRITQITFLSKKIGNKAMKEVIASYTYKNNDLISATNYWGNTYTYQYDTEHNLVKATWPGQKSIDITYNGNDWVKSLKGTDICSENYDYKTDTTKSPARYAVSISKKCDGGVIIERSYAYSYSLDNRRIVAAEVDESGIRREYKYDDHGNVVTVTEHRPRGTVITKIERNNKGQIVKVSSPFEARTYSYKQGASRDLVVAVLVEQIALGHVADKLKYALSYDQEDRMISASKPGGKKIEFFYDEENRLSRVSHKDTVVYPIYPEGKLQARALKYNDKELPLEIYSKRSTASETAAVELYYDHQRMAQITLPSY
ncbi:DUF6531 domain-containing protein [Bdellovibrio reynosensis]|uniref:DUF6531 domain-containing protein n=2 Tax=Bdellovibrio reynosensis TaxID=2835041 RepID=A0ABY4CBK9_9BACT|nr:DUF6531 domain-containing protein [Bdellovibrio reynosensis]UOF00898.1 DUF6531 domain-containing protein [Bdellovibrio reynosensis]